MPGEFSLGFHERRRIKIYNSSSTQSAIRTDANRFLGITVHEHPPQHEHGRAMGIKRRTCSWLNFTSLISSDQMSSPGSSLSKRPSSSIIIPQLYSPDFSRSVVNRFNKWNRMIWFFICKSLKRMKYRAINHLSDLQSRLQTIASLYLIPRDLL